jgi:hypothetical protein
MRRSVVMFSLFLAIPAFAKDVYFPIAGSTSSLGNFRTDVRLFNPSSSKDITVTAFVLPVGNKNNTSVSSRSLTVPKRGMMVLNDVITQLGGTDLNAIRFSSADDFVATERVYATQSATGACNITGTLGQDVTALDPASALKTGLLLQLKTTSQFRTNIGVVNPNSSTANITFKLYDKNNALVSTGSAIAVQPMGVIGPTNMTSGTFFSPGSADLSEAWVSYSSDQPVLVYASLVDNGTSDPTFIAMNADSGSSTTGTPSTKTVQINVHQFTIDVPGGLATAILPGDVVTFQITNTDPNGKLPHGFEMDDPNGNQIFTIASVAPGQTLTRGPFTFTTQGTYNAYCTQVSCGDSNQHGLMFVQLIVGQPSDGQPRPGY